MVNSFVVGSALVLGGCCLNNVFLENLVRADTRCGPLLTLLQFAFIAFMECGAQIERVPPLSLPQLKRTSTPLWWYILLTGIFWTLSVLNNMAYDYEISQPLHMVFRSSSLAVSLLLGFTLFRKSYSSPQVLGVLIVTLGIFVTTFADTRPVPLSQAASAASSSVACDGAIGCYAASMTQWLGFGASPRKLIGVGILLSGLFLSALLGHLQSLGYARWKKDESEAIFYQHFFSVLFFAPLTGQLAERAAFWSESDVFWTFGPISLTWLWFNVVGNLITQYICVKGVYLLVSTSGPVTATLVLTIRKFVSLIISILFFNNLWTFFHWIGTALVFGGAIVYSADSLWKK